MNPSREADTYKNKKKETLVRFLKSISKAHPQRNQRTVERTLPEKPIPTKIRKKKR